MDGQLRVELADLRGYADQVGRAGEACASLADYVATFVPDGDFGRILSLITPDYEHLVLRVRETLEADSTRLAGTRCGAAARGAALRTYRRPGRPEVRGRRRDRRRRVRRSRLPRRGDHRATGSDVRRRGAARGDVRLGRRPGLRAGQGPRWSRPAPRDHRLGGRRRGQGVHPGVGVGALGDLRGRRTSQPRPRRGRRRGDLGRVRRRGVPRPRRRVDRRPRGRRATVSPGSPPTCTT